MFQIPPDWSDDLIPTPVDDFDEWLRVPVAHRCEDPRFDVWRASPRDFERVWDVVDAAFHKKRSRALYEWQYLRNPSGTPRVWITSLRETGQFIKVGGGFPWPIWRDREVLRGSVGGDAATLPEWQRKGLSAIRRHVQQSHPWYDTTCSISGPNAGSRVVIRKAGQGEQLLGRLRGGVAPLRATSLFARFGLPAVLARPLGSVVDLALAPATGTLRPRARRDSARVESVARFDSAYDEVTERTMHWSGYWCPHNADFLNWRYLDHPVEEYVALALVEADHPIAYAVVRLAGAGATLAEFAVERSAPERAAHLVLACRDLAREAGCAYLDFFSTPAWRHWPFFRRAGFLPYASHNHFEVRYEERAPEAYDVRNWQITPGDRDYH